MNTLGGKDVNLGRRACVSDWLQALSAPRASPAAGSALAIAGAFGVSLLIKLGGLTSPDAVPSRDALLQRLEETRERLATLAEADAANISAWLRTRALPADEAMRQSVLRSMAEIPLEAAELCAAAVVAARPLLENGSGEALPDGRAGAELLGVCRRSLCDLVRVNLPALQGLDESEATQVRLAALDAPDPRLDGR